LINTIIGVKEQFYFEVERSSISGWSSVKVKTSQVASYWSQIEMKKSS